MTFQNEPYVPVLLDGNDRIYIRFTPNDSDREEASLRTYALNTLLPKLKSFCGGLKSALTSATPDKIQVKFGVEISVENSELIPLIVPCSGKGVIEITLEWEPKK